MSFLLIHDPKMRDKIVADYQSTLRLDEKTIQDRSSRPRAIENKGEESKILSKLFDFPTNKLDSYFRIYQLPNGLYRLGDAHIEFKNDKIIVDGTQYVCTLGLIELIMLKTPLKFTAEDLDSYFRLVEQTKLIHHPINIKPNSRIKSTHKWLHIFSKMPSQKRDGEGIQFLPGDIKGLQTKLSYLLGEYHAGNTAATHNQIVAVADELLRRGKISKEEYHNINCSINKDL